jgi:hypothetical protein
MKTASAHLGTVRGRDALSTAGRMPALLLLSSFRQGQHLRHEADEAIFVSEVSAEHFVSLRNKGHPCRVGHPYGAPVPGFRRASRAEPCGTVFRKTH